MSLIAWIPSNFSSDKERCLHRLITLNNLTTSNLGTKLGKRYIFNGSSSSLIIPNVLLSTDMTFVLWVKFNTLKNCFLLDARTTEVGYLPIYFNTASGVQVYSSNGSSQYIPTGALSANTWYHFAVTIKNGIGTLYINGVKKGSTSNIIAKCTNISNITVGARYTLDTATTLDGSVEDIRIYDHCLSLKEVKELAKGLIFHYSFNDEINEATINECNLNDWESYTSYWTINEKTETGLKLLRTSTTASSTVALRNPTLLGKMTAGDVWTFSCYLYVDGEPYKTSINTLSTYAGYTKTKVESRDDGYFSVTFTVNNTSDTWVIHSAIFGKVELNIPCELRYMLFEKRDRATPYTKTSRYIQFYMDESGNGYNALPSSLTFTLDSNYGTLAAKFNGSTSGLAVPNIKLDLMTSDYTLAFWIYPNTNNRDTIFGDYGTSGPSNVNIERKSSTGNLRIYYTSTNDLDMGSSTSMPMNTWTQIVITYNGNTKLFTIYKNGIPVTSKTLDVSGYVKSTGGTWWIGRDGRSSAPENLDGLLSDFKFYSTCLSENDVKDLYDVKLNISNKNDILCPLFLENETSFSLNKKFQLKSEEFEELDIPPEYQKLDYITFNGSLYIDTGYKANQDTSVRMMVSSSSTANQAFYCSRSGLSNNTYSCFIVDSKIRHDYGATQTAVNVTATKNLLYKIDNYKNILKINGVTHTINKTSFTASQSMYIGASNANGIGNYLHGNVYYCIIYDKDLIVKHLIPVKRLSDNVIGMYDIVTNLFLTNSGTGTFTPGDESSTNSELNIFKNGIILCRQLIED